MMKYKSNILNNFSKHLFWDINKDELDLEKHQKYLIKKVLQYGTYQDWKIIVSVYGLKNIIDTAKKIKDLDQKTLSFLSFIGQIPKTEFLCYTSKQSAPKHWNF